MFHLQDSGRARVQVALYYMMMLAVCVAWSYFGVALSIPSTPEADDGGSESEATEAETVENGEEGAALAAVRQELDTLRAQVAGAGVGPLAAPVGPPAVVPSETVAALGRFGRGEEAPGPISGLGLAVSQGQRMSLTPRLSSPRANPPTL